MNSSTNSSVIAIRDAAGKWIGLTKGARAGAAYRFHISSEKLPKFRQPLAQDLQAVACAFFLADRYFRRSPLLGRRQRVLAIRVAVSSPRTWRRVTPQLESWAGFVTHDQWKIYFVPMPKGRRLPRRPGSPTNPTASAVALFSGGLDSLCGAVAAWRSGLRPIFVAHNPPGPPTIRRLLHSLGSVFAPGQEPPFVSFRLQAIPWTSGGMRSRFPERTRRSRALFFLSLAGSVALEQRCPLVLMNENGVLAINLPLFPHSTGAQITRHSHPETLRRFEAILKALWPWPGPRPRVRNLLAHLTKQDSVEVLGRHASQAADSISCEYSGQQMAMLRHHFRSRRQTAPMRECGLCLPCLVRRSALANAGVREEESHYAFAIADASRSPRRFPPLLRVVRDNVETLRKFCHWILAMSQREFLTEFLVEISFLSGDWRESTQAATACHAIYRRFARQFLHFLRESS